MLYSMWMYATNPIVIFTCIIITMFVDGFFKAFFITLGIGILFSTGLLYEGQMPGIVVVTLITLGEVFIVYFFKRNYFLLVQTD